MTLQQIQKFLYTNAGMHGMEGTDPDIEAAIYWYASDWHSGQSSDLYAVLCASPYTPGPMENSPENDLDSESYCWYNILQDELLVNKGVLPD